ncbi:MAG: putative bifunctional diguanylate cyclase/phosphodiesterase [Lachnospiraceae bacterium]
MNFNLDLEIGAFVIILVVIFMHRLEKFVNIRRCIIFRNMLFAHMFAIVFNSLSSVCLYYYGEEGFVWSKYLVNLAFAFRYAVVLFFMSYLISWIGKSLKRDRKNWLFTLIVFSIYTEEILRMFVSQHLFVYDPQYGYQGTKQLYILNIMVIVTILYSLIYSIVNTRIISYRKMTIISAISVIVIFAIMVQSQIPEVSFIDFVIAISFLILYFVVQNPFEMMDINTKVLNRNMFDELLRADIYNRRSFDLIVLALDDFKIVNRSYGVTVGDMLLIQVAQFLREIDNKAIVYRYGSDQFAVELMHKKSDLNQTLSKIEERFRHPWIVEGVSAMLSTTVCCVTWPDDGDSYADIIDVIDFSVLTAKKFGKGSTVYAKDLDLQSIRREKAIEQAIDSAIEQDTLEVHYQPIYNTEKGCYTSAEALVRIRDDRLGNISPEVFIPIAERNGSILKMGNMIFEKVCRFISENNLHETTIEYIEINVSVVQCMQEDFVENLNGIMEKYGVKPSQINLEVTETAAVNSIAILQENIERLYQQGISFALDDYGSGYATIGYIHQLPFKIIKLDKLMVWDAFENERAGITLRYTVGMLKELKVNIVAEGVETVEQQKRLSDIGCDYLQGWYYAKAMPPEEFASLIKAAS